MKLIELNESSRSDERAPIVDKFGTARLTDAARRTCAGDYRTDCVDKLFGAVSRPRRQITRCATPGLTRGRKVTRAGPWRDTAETGLANFSTGC